MKNIFKILIFASTLTIVSCSDPKTEVAPIKPVVYKEYFDPNLLQEDAYLDFNNWTSYAEAGTIKWTEQDDDGNGYLQFSTFQLSGGASNIAWAITPKINLDNSENEILNFKTGRGFASNANNKMEVYISTNFDGTNVSAANWTKLTANIAASNNPTGVGNGVMTTDSGDVDLSSYSGNIYLGFKAYGSSTMTGSLRFDEVKIYDKTLK